MLRRTWLATIVAATLGGVLAVFPVAQTGAATPHGGDLDGLSREGCKTLPVGPAHAVASPDGVTGTGYAIGVGAHNTALSIVPPLGWSPVRATDAQLKAFGFPARPKDPAGRAAWVSEWSHYVGTAAPGLCAVTDRIFDSSPNWSGMELATSTRNSYFSVSSRFTQPTFVSVCPHASDHPIWAGLGGDPAYEASIIQTGTEVDQSGLNVDYGWYEIIHDVNNPIIGAEDPVKFTSWVVNAGNDVRASVTYLSPGAAGNTSGQVTISLFNISTGLAAPTQVIDYWNGLPIYSYVTGRTAEWVDERGLTTGADPVDGGFFYLRKTTARTVWSSASTNGNSIYGAANEQTNWIYSNSAAETLENSSGVVTTGGGFYDYWDHCPGE